MKFRSPLARARGLGSAKDGTHHWWAQRITAVALIPLSLWFMGSLVSLAGAEHAAVVAWFHSPVVASLWMAFIVALFHHAQLGVQVVVEDYVSSEWLKIATIVATKLLSILLAVICALAVLRIAFRG